MWCKNNEARVEATQAPFWNINEASPDEKNKVLELAKA
jgi:hypothetical protein